MCGTSYGCHTQSGGTTFSAADSWGGGVQVGYSTSIITRSGARFTHPLLVYEFRDCCFDWLEGRDRL